MSNYPKSILFLLVSALFLSCRGQGLQEGERAAWEPDGPGQAVSEMDPEIWTILHDSKGNYWFGSQSNGLYRYDGQHLRNLTTADGLPGNTVRGIQEDQQGNLFLETSGGICQYNGKAFRTLKAIRSDSSRWQLSPADLWFKGDGNSGNVYRFDGGSLMELQLPSQDIRRVLGIVDEHLPYSPYSVYGVDKDREGNLWLGTLLAGAFRFDGASFLWIGERELSMWEDGRVPAVRSMLQDKNGHHWLSNCINKYEIILDSLPPYRKLPVEDWSFTVIDKSNLYFNSGLVDQRGDLWMTSFNGLVMHFDGQNLKTHLVSEAGKPVLLNCIYEDNKGMLWLGSQGEGVFQYDGKEFIKYYFK